MLMYRQIDSERNVQAMEVEDFPEHIKVIVHNVFCLTTYNNIKNLGTSATFSR